MTRGDRAPRPGEGVGVDRLVQAALELLDVHARLRRVQPVKQHSLLQR